MDAPTKGRSTFQPKSLYNYAWQQYRERYLREHPFCVMCLKAGLYVASTVVDHITPHDGNKVLFLSPANHQALCKPCHDGPKQRADWRNRGGR